MSNSPQYPWRDFSIDPATGEVFVYVRRESGHYRRRCHPDSLFHALVTRVYVSDHRKRTRITSHDLSFWIEMEMGLLGDMDKALRRV